MQPHPGQTPTIATKPIHSMVLHVDNVSWADSHMWAPDAVYWKGRYYLVYCAKQARKRHGPIFRTGMAVSDKPTGPFKDVGFVQGIEWYAMGW